MTTLNSENSNRSLPRPAEESPKRHIPRKREKKEPRHYGLWRKDDRPSFRRKRPHITGRRQDLARPLCHAATTQRDIIACPPFPGPPRAPTPPCRAVIGNCDFHCPLSPARLASIIHCLGSLSRRSLIYTDIPYIKAAEVVVVVGEDKNIAGIFRSPARATFGSLPGEARRTPHGQFR